MAFRNKRYASKFTGVILMPFFWSSMNTDADLLREVQRYNSAGTEYIC